MPACTLCTDVPTDSLVAPLPSISVDELQERTNGLCIEMPLQMSHFNLS